MKESAEGEIAMKATIASLNLAAVLILLVLVAPAFAQDDESARFC